MPDAAGVTQAVLTLGVAAAAHASWVNFPAVSCARTTSLTISSTLASITANPQPHGLPNLATLLSTCRATEFRNNRGKLGGGLTRSNTIDYASFIASKWRCPTK